MHLEKGEIKHDGSIEDRRLYLHALERGLSPGAHSNLQGRLERLVPGFFEGELNETETVLRGLVRMSMGQTEYSAVAVEHLFRFSKEAIEASRDQIDR